MKADSGTPVHVLDRFSLKKPPRSASHFSRDTPRFEVSHSDCCATGVELPTVDGARHGRWPGVPNSTWMPHDMAPPSAVQLRKGMAKGLAGHGDDGASAPRSKWKWQIKVRAGHCRQNK